MLNVDMIALLYSRNEVGKAGANCHGLRGILSGSINRSLLPSDMDGIDQDLV
jgi:hypothetical protein